MSHNTQSTHIRRRALNLCARYAFHFDSIFLSTSATFSFICVNTKPYVRFFQFLYERMCQLTEAIEYDQRDMKGDHQRAKYEPHQGQIGVASVGLCPYKKCNGILSYPASTMKATKKTYAWVEIFVFLLSRIIITLLIMPDYSNHVLISIISAGP